MAGEQADMEYISLHGYIRNALSDRSPCRTPAESRQEDLTSRKEYMLPLLLSRFSRVRPHRQQPTRLPRPWDSPGKNTGMGRHFLLQCVKVKGKSLSRVRLLATPWTATSQAPLSMEFSRQEYWSGVPLPSPKEYIEPHKTQ